MKGKKLVFAVILALLVCLLLVPTCAFAEEEATTDNPSTLVEGGEKPATPVEGEDKPTTPVEGGEKPATPVEGDGKPTAPAQPTESNSSFMVEFSYGDKSYKLDNLTGNEQFGLADILKELGIEGNIDNAEGDADDLFAAENSEEGWKVTTKKAFGTKQTMTVVVDGVEYVLNVIDDMEAGDLAALEDFIAKNTTATIKIKNDIEGNIVIPEGKTITIDLNGKKLKSGSGHVLTNNGKLTVKDTVGGGIVEGAGGALLNNGEAHLVAGTYSAPSGTIITNYGKVTTENGVTVKFSEGKSGRLLVENGWQDSTKPADGTSIAQFIINGGTYGHETQNEYGLYNYGNAYLEINDGAVLKARRVTIRNNYRTNGKIPGELVINNANIVAGYEGAILSFKGGEVEINGGTFTGEYGLLGSYGGDFNGANKLSKVTINGGTFTSKKDLVLYSTANTKINGGTFNSAAGKPAMSVTSGKTEITGGTFNSDVVKTNGEDATLQDYVSDNFAVSNSNGKFTVGKANNANAQPTAPLAESPVKQVYEVVEGKDQTVEIAKTEKVTFTVNAEAQHVQQNLVKIVIKNRDGNVVVETVDYTVDEDGKIILSAELLEKLGLEEGEYEIEFIFTDGSCKTLIKVVAAK